MLKKCMLVISVIILCYSCYSFHIQNHKIISKRSEISMKIIQDETVYKIISESITKLSEKFIEIDLRTKRHMRNLLNLYAVITITITIIIIVIKIMNKEISYILS